MNIVISGASSGIGFHTALELARRGHHVLAFSRSAVKLEKLKALSSNRGNPGKITVLPFDLAYGDIPGFVENAIKPVFERVDVLINNAGSLINKPFAETSDAELEKVFRVNFMGVFSLIRSLLPLMEGGRIAQEGNTISAAAGEVMGRRLGAAVKVSGQYLSSIINIGSIGGISGSQKFPGLSAYSSSKGALSILSEVLAVELEEKGISVNCLALGAVQTEMLQEAFPGYQAKQSPEIMGDFIADFVEKGSRVFNGKTIPVSVSNP